MRLLLLFAALIIAPPTQAAERREPVTILVSIDGFRADYLERGLTPTLSALAKDGVSGAMTPSFPSKTYPNHAAIATGLHPDRSGIVGNHMEDPAHGGLIFALDVSLETFWWDQAEPIWVAAERANIPTAALFWPGSNVAFEGVRPTAWFRYQREVPGTQRIDALLDWLRRPARERPRFLVTYLDPVDSAGHSHGTSGPELDASLREVDGNIARLREGLTALGQPANMIIVADHGMADTSPDRVLWLKDIADPADYRTIEDGPYAAIYPTQGHEARLAASLLKPHAHFACYRHDTIPTNFQFGRNPRVPPFLCLADVGWMLRDKTSSKEMDRGTHGYDNRAPEMRALFIANGPRFARGRTIENMRAVDVYPLLRDLLHLPPKAGIDGSDAPFRGLIRR
jgi:predicted AlkP superfamily pyrophosphatase or phosphodiesterase